MCKYIRVLADFLLKKITCPYYLEFKQELVFIGR